jgi:hypothetical protein
MEEKKLIELWPAMLAYDNRLTIEAELQAAKDERERVLRDLDSRIAGLTAQRDRQERIVAPLHSLGVADEEIKFWSRVRILGDGDSCWEFTGSTRDRKNENYGNIRFQGKIQLAHRVAFQLAHPGEPMPAAVMHSCDNPPCCRPGHLRGGTQADNVIDAASKKRMRGKANQRGEANDWARLTDQIVLEGRRRYRLGESIGQLAQHFDVPLGTLQGALNGKTWTHLNAIEPPIEGRRSGTRFTEDDIRAIRADYARKLGENPPRGLHGRLCEEIARRHGGMTAANINAIVRRKSWAHVE